MSSRCIVCNSPLKPEEILWRPDVGQHETHCNKCLHELETEVYDDGNIWNDRDPTEST